MAGSLGQRLALMNPAATLIEDRGAAAEEPAHFFRSRAFYDAEGVTHTLRIEAADSELALPVLVRAIDEQEGAIDASSPYSYPGGALSGAPIDPAAVDFSATGLVSLFVRDRLGEPAAFAGGKARARVQVSDPELPRKSRMSDRQQIRKNEAAGYEVSGVSGPDSDGELRAEFLRVYTETMRLVDASERYFFDAAYFDQLLAFRDSWLFTVTAADGEVAAVALAARSDGFLHYYLSGTADQHRRQAPSKNLIVAVTDHAEQLRLPLNLGGGLRPGDGLEEFKRGFANAELPWRTHEIICEPDAYRRLAAAATAGTETRFFPAYRAPA